MAMGTLLGRDVDLDTLETAWRAASGGTPQLAVVWGRRRVGKTFLLSHLVEGKRALFFGATQQAEAVELRRFAEAVGRDLGPVASDLAGGGFASWESALRFVVALAREQPLVVVLDEAPYLARSTRGFASIVQVVWDHLPPGTRLMLVLTGSAVGTIESMLGAGGALRGRPTVTMRLDPLTAPEARGFLPQLSPTAYLEAYAACGGYPLHLRRWDGGSGTGANLTHLALTPGGLLLEDALGILGEELPDVGGYPRILAAIGRGRTRASEIADEAAQRIEHPLEVLVRTGLVRRSVPLGAPRRARPVYEIDDPYLAFWFSVLYSDLAQIDRGQGHAVLHHRRDQWQRHLGWMFEELARQHAARLVAAGALPEDLIVGRWWSTSGPPAEVDVLGMRGTRTALLGEARWQSRPLGPRDVRALGSKVTAVPDPIEEPLLVLWGRSGLEPGSLSEMVRGYDLDEMLSPDVRPAGDGPRRRARRR
ncbi:MAG: ATP-binding protein [Chloroflexi bacterium]|nr:ATP-binding protein [Chloroflexota bacterium]